MSDWDALLNAPVVFGLKAQGHLPTIGRMLGQGKTWEEIGKAIGWCPDTAKEHYRRMHMLDRLANTLKILPPLLNDKSKWVSLIINRRKPWTYRVHTQLDDLRVCLHRFEVCEPEESFFHPHPWAGAFVVLQGGYRMGVGYSQSRTEKPKPVMVIELSEGCRYEITDPNTWHSVTPLGLTYSVMINTAPWTPDFAHQDVRTTKGKDLEIMSDEALTEHLQTFKGLIGKYHTFHG